MGIRFACHVCGKRLNIKQELAGRRGICPACSARFRIPREDTETSSPVELRADDSSRSRWNGERSSPTTAGVATIPAPAVVGTSRRTTASPSPQGDLPESLLDQDPDAAWYVRPPAGGQYGPASGETLKQWIDQGRVAIDALLWRDGWPQWRDAGVVLEDLAERLPGHEQEHTPSHGQKPGLEQKPGGDGRGLVATSQSSSAGDSLAEHAPVGAVRRRRTSNRTMLIGILTGLAVILIAVLVVVINR